jgi:peroxiredoxin-like protein
MQELPHVYKVNALALPVGHVFLSASDKHDIESSSPREFGGPGNAWSPEELVVAAIADCLVLSFKTIASASKFSWISLECNTEGTLDQVDGAYQFTHFRTVAILKVDTNVSAEHAKRLMIKAESMCPVTNSMKARTMVEIRVTLAGHSES